MEEFLERGGRASIEEARRCSATARPYVVLRCGDAGLDPVYARHRKRPESAASPPWKRTSSIAGLPTDSSAATSWKALRRTKQTGKTRPGEGAP